MERLLLRYSLKTDLDFKELKEFFIQRIGNNYKRGSINNDIISVYYNKTKATDYGLDQIPIMKIKVRNRNDNTKIQFGVARYYLIFILLIPIAAILFKFVVDMPIPLYYLFCLYPLFYLVLHIGLNDQLNKFKYDLRKYEIVMKVNAKN